MFKGLRTLQKLADEKITAVVRGDTPEEAEAIAVGCIEGGVKSIEVTFTTPGADDIIRSLKKEHPECLTGAGSVLDPETARLAMLAGADYVVSPCFDKETAMICNRYHVPYIPGCMTVKEMKEASEYGADLIKLFPGNHFAPGMIKAVKGPLPTVEIMPTGGVNLENMQDWLDAGAAAVGVGSEWNKAYKSHGQEGVRQAAEDFVSKLDRK
ncbi:bifunctional 2-keto-4-hydroxyglutarate aldolase/2-keto-3-deoxy-6-phosphogluconate aldolase [Alteribacter natronophilus]|uniref:bifunctional 2-keto-4-hydroxyglutarate aldolase/2-keto-3-deoxy-6-phosphogluconate aldolase n=1 Tax=Alteribacter natronophilus TaxID=2583810 RepID=UPI00110D6F59|nr:bifunctional 2-keto-4-hydroxyglutarate aldolase/2-keto-3-deoxy-6-phosphogluconate aldolase [Alteribacter natronophilus]TMW72294.1 bifunctional 4-hydroxy-2-oxoglutarate aldolase/2-dehydro-3-deoxy-phosphogluconate aldolase [Alteribacter natronophilus]